MSNTIEGVTRMVVKKQIKKWSDEIEYADASDPAYCDLMSNIEGQVQTILKEEGVN